MTGQEKNRAVQYVTASTSYSRDTIAEIIQIAFDELQGMTEGASRTFSRGDLLEYICQWTLKKTGHPEPMVREILECSGRWLDLMCEEFK